MSLGPPSSSLYFDEGRKIDHLNGQDAVLEGNRVRQQLVESATVMEYLQGIERPERSGEIQLTGSLEMINRGAQLPVSWLSYDGIQAFKCRKQTSNIVVSGARYDIRIQRCDGGAVKHRSSAADHYEIDSGRRQRL